MTIRALPPGFEPLEAASAFTGQLGTAYLRREAPGRVTLGQRVTAQHLNQLGSAHGGFIASLVDEALGLGILEVERRPLVTVQLGIDFLDSVRLDDWLEVETEVDRKGLRMIFARCIGRVGGRACFRGSGIFSVVHLAMPAGRAPSATS